LTKIRFDEIQAGYGNLVITYDATLSVETGQIVCIVGPNGSGKSTLIKCLFGMSRIFSGKVYVDGEDLNGKSPRYVVGKRHVAYVPQVGNVFPSLSIDDNLRICALAAGNANREEDKHKALELFPILKERKSQRVSTLSGGERQMVAVSMAITAGANALVLDEPTAGLAPRAAVKLIGSLAALTENGFTILLVEQNAKSALEIADKAAVMVSGRLIYEGDPDTLLSGEELGHLFMMGKSN
jgi:branched-chain amino acid transport system ATP-binding protein